MSVTDTLDRGRGEWVAVGSWEVPQALERAAGNASSGFRWAKHLVLGVGLYLDGPPAPTPRAAASATTGSSPDSAANSSPMRMRSTRAGPSVVGMTAPIGPSLYTSPESPPDFDD